MKFSLGNEPNAAADDFYNSAVEVIGYFFYDVWHPGGNFLPIDGRYARVVNRIGSRTIRYGLGRNGTEMSYSVLFPEEKRTPRNGQDMEPECFKDLNLDQIVHPILIKYEAYGLDDLFFTPLTDFDTILYRQEVLRDLESDDLRTVFSAFSKTIFELNAFMDHTRELLSSQDTYKNNYLAKGRMFDFANRYRSAITKITDRLAGKDILSEGLQGIVSYLLDYQKSEKFAGLKEAVENMKKELSSVQYCMLIKSGTIRVRKYEGQSDLSADIRDLFARFRQGDVKDYRHKLTEDPRAEHVEAAVLNLVAACYPEAFSDLNDFCSSYLNFIDPIVARFAREIQFYLSWLESIRPLKEKGLPFCYPEMASDADRLHDFGFFDLALAASMNPGGRLVLNDFTLNDPERILVVTGPNQGGKTTFARAFGQIHYLASLGLCVPGRDASLLLFDRIFAEQNR